MWAWLSKVMPASAQSLLRLCVAAVLIGIAFWRGLHADEFTLDWQMIVLLLSAAIVVTLLPAFLEILRLVRSIALKFGDLSLELGLAVKAAEASMLPKAPAGRRATGRIPPVALSIDKAPEPGESRVLPGGVAPVKSRVAPPDFALETSIWELAAVDKRSGFLSLLEEIEKELRRLHDAHTGGVEPSPATLSQLVAALERMDVLPAQAARAVRVLRGIRDTMVHLRPRELEAGIVSVINSGVDLLRLLETLPRPEGPDVAARSAPTQDS